MEDVVSSTEREKAGTKKGLERITCRQSCMLAQVERLQRSHVIKTLIGVLLHVAQSALEDEKNGLCRVDVVYRESELTYLRRVALSQANLGAHPTVSLV